MIMFFTQTERLLQVFKNLKIIRWISSWSIFEGNINNLGQIQISSWNLIEYHKDAYKLSNPASKPYITTYIYMMQNSYFHYRIL